MSINYPSHPSNFYFDGDYVRHSGPLLRDVLENIFFSHVLQKVLGKISEFVLHLYQKVAVKIFDFFSGNSI